MNKPEYDPKQRKPFVPVSPQELKYEEDLLAGLEANNDTPSDDAEYLARKAIREANREHARRIWDKK
jgi:hypothetical protein